MAEIRDLKAKNDIVRIIEIVTNQTLKRQGAEMVGFCPFHTDKTKSLKVNPKKQIFKCFACGPDGDVIDFLKEGYESKGLNEKDAFKKAIEFLKKQDGAFKIEVKNTTSKKTTHWEALPFGPHTNQIVHYKHGKPNSIWRYLNPEGKTIGYVCRFNLPNGSKEVLPFSYCSNGTLKVWRFRAFARPRPLYNWDQIVARPKANIVLVEGEKTADAAQKLFPHMVCTTWPGGSNAINYVNWEILKGRTILVWPDNDKEQTYGETHEKAGELKPFHEQPGNQAMLQICDKLKTLCPIVKWISNDPSFPNKWDVADHDGWTSEFAINYARNHIIDVPKPSENVPSIPAEVPRAANPIPDELPPEIAEVKTSKNSISEYKGYFSFLGYEKTEDSILHAFYVKETRTVQKYSASALGRISTFISIAPLDFWESMFLVGKSKKVQTDMALNWLIRSSQQKGFFSSDSMRGRGAWMDAGRAVFHAGDHLVCNGKIVPLGELKSKYIYEAGQKLGYSMKNPMVTKDAHKLITLCKAMNWSRDINAYLLAGWCVIAPICGALVWRSHIWITGPAGSGKSWLLKEIIRPLLGETALSVQSETTEPGLRQLIKSDAMPVVFDEAEAEDRQQQQSIRKVLGLMRAASADDGGFLVKGSSSGIEKKYRIRSCFAFASIGVTATQQSDKTRITLLTLKVPPDGKEKEENWAKLQKMHLDTINDEYAVNLQARTLNILPTIISNAAVFAKAATALLGKQRIGDQIGSLLAGAYSLSSNNKISYEDAVEWIKEKDWSEERELEESRDENRLLSHILERLIRCETPNGGSVERSIGELVGLCLGKYDDPILTDTGAERILNRMGFKFHDEFDKIKNDSTPYLAISNTSGHIRKMLFNTPWASNWSKVLVRVDGGIDLATTRFTVTKTSRAVAIPVEFITGIDKTNTSVVPPDELPF